MKTVKKWLVGLFIVAVIFFAGFYTGYRYYVPELKAALDEVKLQNSALHELLDKEQKKPPQIITEAKTKTEIAYVPKETIIYRDAQTDETVTGLEDTDAELTIKPPTIHMKYNGKDYEMPGVSGETAKFEKGKLVGEVSTAATVDVTDLVNEEVNARLAAERKHVSIDGYITNQGFAASLGVVNKNLEYKVISTVPDYKKFYGAGISFKF